MPIALTCRESNAVPTHVDLIPAVIEPPQEPVAAAGPNPPAENSTPVLHRHSGKKWLALIAFLLVTAAAAALYFSRRAGQPEYTTAVVDRGDIESAITATGNCNAVVTVQVGSQVSGNIIALYADFNTKVKQGQLVARIDPAIFKAQVDQAKANLDTAKAAAMTARATLQKSLSDLASAQANVAAQKANVVKAQSVVALDKVENERRIVLLRQDATSKEDADTAQANYDQAVASVDAAQAAEKASEAAAESAKKQVEVAQTQLDQAEATVKQNDAALEQAQLNLDHTQIIAPVDGTVVSRNMDVGQTVAASFQAPVIFLIAQDLTKMQVDTNVDESDVGPIRVGQTANFTVDAYPGVMFPGKVAQIRQAPINVQNVITYDVVDSGGESGPEAVSGHDGDGPDRFRQSFTSVANSSGGAAISSGRSRPSQRASRPFTCSTAATSSRPMSSSESATASTSKC